MISPPPKPFHHIGIIGAGAWGTALALVVCRRGSKVTLWVRDSALAEDMATTRQNEKYLPGPILDPDIRITNTLADLSAVDAIFLAIPAQYTAETGRQFAPHLDPEIPILACAKGIERHTHRFMSEVVSIVLPGRSLAILSGPSFADEVASGQPTAVMVAGLDAAITRRFADSLADGRLRPYIGRDPRGAEIGGAVKNVLAIGSGIIRGRHLGDNAQAALITRGLAEMIRFGKAYGAKEQTLTGLAGLGDLCLTCGSKKSRNTRLGMALGAGNNRQQGVDWPNFLAEGAWTVEAIVDMAAKLSLSMPICQTVDAILNHKADIDEAIDILLARPLTSE